MIFPYQVNGIGSADYILSHSLPRPRDVLGFCQAAIDQAQRNGHSEVLEQDILDGEISFADNFIRSIAAEFRGLYPALEEVLLEFAGVSSVIQWEEFRRYATVAIARNQRNLVGWTIEAQVDEMLMADVLFRIGAIGLAAEPQREPHYRNGRSFRETWRLVSPLPIVHIHPAFHKVLARIHRRGGSWRSADSVKGCSFESGIMVFDRKTNPGKGAPFRCYHATAPTAST